MTAKKATEKFNELKSIRDKEWYSINENSEWSNYILNNNFDIRFYAIYLIETYHYVMHNPKHQALVGALSLDKRFNYVKFCYEHAEEETGHEMMALHDLISLGLEKDSFEIPKPLASTEVFIAYLYYISTNGNTLQRLGYSFWAEDSYQYIGRYLETLKTKLKINKNQMTFLISHSTIDEKHAEDINNMILKFSKTEDDWESIEKVLKMSLKLQNMMLEEVLNEYKILVEGSKSRYSFLNELISK